MSSKLVLIETEDGYEETKTTLEKASGPRGLGTINFQDRYQQECSLQDSSLATEAAIWIGVDSTGPYIDGPNGTRNEKVGARMHLTQAMVKQLLPFLQEFADRGEFVAKMKIKKEKE